jgi:hypothetical protein
VEISTDSGVIRADRTIAAYAIMCAVILALVVATVRLIGSNSNFIVSPVASSIQ